ncbi:MAG: phosphoribosyltransferase [Anaerolineae bacterium]|nr:phosphoribosyltransferase [Anaerolineae bacterium]
MGLLFKDRRDAGRRLAKALMDYADRTGVIVLALPRGGVPVAFEVAKTLHVPLDVLLVRKPGVPGQEELAMGAVASGGVRVFNDDVLRTLQIPDRAIEIVAAKEQQEIERGERAYRGDRPRLDVRGQTAVLVDDGLATGASMRAAVSALRAQEPAHVIVAVPVATPEACESFRDSVDEVVCVETPRPFLAVGAWYEDFSQTTDEEVRGLLEQAADLSQSQRVRSGRERKGRTWSQATCQEQTT